MAVPWLNAVTLQVAGNGTTAHTVDPSSGTPVAGALFTPTAGRMLLCIVEGGVTSTTPSGWTLPTNGSAVNFTGLYLWYRTAAGSDTISTTHNASNYPIVVTFLEFAAGTTFVKSASGGGIGSSSANPTLSALTGTNILLAAAAQSVDTTGTFTWTGTPTPVEWVDATQPTPPGYNFTLAYVESSAATSWAPTATGTSTTAKEGLTFAFAPPAGGTTPVTKTLTSTWKVRAAIAKAVATSWKVRQAVVDTTAASWKVRTTATAARAASWRVRQAIGKTAASSWAVRAQASRTVATSWNVLSLAGAVVKTIATSWKVRQQLAGTAATSWRVRQAVGQATAASWRVRAAVGVTRAASWRVRGLIARLAPTSWNTLSNRVARDISPRFVSLTGNPARVVSVDRNPASVVTVEGNPVRVTSLEIS